MDGERELRVQAIDDASIRGGRRSEHGGEAAVVQGPGRRERGRQAPEDPILRLGVVVAVRGEVVDREEKLDALGVGRLPVVGPEADRFVGELDRIDVPVLGE